MQEQQEHVARAEERVKRRKTEDPNYLTEEYLQRACRIRDERNRPDREIGSQGQAVGFGSWYDRRPGDYTRAEFFATQGHEDRVRTADCIRKDQEERQMLSDDSGLELTWERRTGRNNDDFRKEHQVRYDFKLDKYDKEEIEKGSKYGLHIVKRQKFLKVLKEKREKKKSPDKKSPDR